jgi:MFS family permease
MVAVLGMVILVGMGERMAERFLPLYLIALGGGAIIIGLLNGLTNLLGALYSFPGGYLSDKYGTRRALLIFNLLAMSGFLIVILVPTIWAVIFGSFFFLCWSAISLPAVMNLVAKVLPKNKRTMGVSMHSLVRRIPMALGPLLGGIFIDTWGVRTGVRMAFVAALVMAVIGTIMQQVMIQDEAAVKGAEGHAEKSPFRLFKEMSPQLKNLLVSDILIRFCEQIPYAFVVVWATEVISSPVSAFRFGILTSIEMATAVLCYIPVAYWADKTQKKPFVVITFMFFTLFPLMLLFTQSFWPLVAAFVLRGLKEFGEPTRKALIMDLAPAGKEARMFGLYYLMRDSVVSLAAFGGGFLWKISPATNLLAAFGFGVIGTIWFALRGQEVVVTSKPETT